MRGLRSNARVYSRSSLCRKKTTFVYYASYRARTHVLLLTHTWQSVSTKFLMHRIMGRCG